MADPRRAADAPLPPSPAPVGAPPPPAGEDPALTVVDGPPPVAPLPDVPPVAFSQVAESPAAVGVPDGGGVIAVYDDPPAPVPETRMLPPHQTKVERVADHVAAISADLREWVELRVALIKRQVEGVVGIFERLQHLLEAAKLAVPGVVLVLIGLLFLLLTVAFAIGALIDSVWGGFAIVTAVLLVVGGALLFLAKKKYDEIQEAVAEAKRQERDQRHVTREDVETAQRRTATLSAS